MSTSTSANPSKNIGRTPVHIGDVNGLYTEAAYHGLDRMRYVDLMDRTLAMHGDPVDTLFPEVDDLEAAGGNLVTLHYALTDGGLSARDFGRAVAAGLDLEVFSNAVLLGLHAAELPRLMTRHEAGGISALNHHLQDFVDARDGDADECLHDEF
ncbi:MAG: hypothetical protein JSS86_21595 [Cyanobacteria bacterium SZAS LIN-2]|nr:hypothetical protein [Cyanobacteria bacterium SZAS LIN-3]MBS1998941.1 hypothetical protein [Cyanobacteria bacterium SZAS LIN-2]